MFVLWIFFVRGMQVMFCNKVYIHVCKICAEKFGGCWWSFSWLGQKVKDTMSIHRPYRPSRLRYVIRYVILLIKCVAP